MSDFGTGGGDRAGRGGSIPRTQKKARPHRSKYRLSKLLDLGTGEKTGQQKAGSTARINGMGRGGECHHVGYRKDKCLYVIGQGSGLTK